MILSQEDRELFYLLYDTITVYANDRLQVSDRMFYGDPQMVDEYEQTKVAMELWKTPSLIDEFLTSEDAESLEPEELAQLRDWDKVLTGVFAVCVQPDGRALFIAEARAFEVWGIAREIGELVGTGPVFVEAALVPLAGKIVYGGFLNQASGTLDARAQAFVATQAERSLQAGSVIASAQDFIAASRAIAEDRVQREVDDMLQDLDALSDDSSVEGTHRGPLAGLSEAERADALAARTGQGGRAMTQEESAQLDGVLDGMLLHERPHGELRRLLLTQTKEELELLARAWRLTGVSSLPKAQLADRLVGVMSQDAATMKLYLSHASEQQVKALRATLEAGGELEVAHETPDDASALDELPLMLEPLAYGFAYGKKIAAVVPVELRGLLGGLDWDELARAAASRQAIVDFAGSLAELRGIVEMHEAFDEYERLFPASGTAFEGFASVLEAQAIGENQRYELLESGNVYYLVYYDLAEEYLDAMKRLGGYREPAGDRAYLHGPLSPLLDGIIGARGGKVARPLEPEMAVADGVLSWELALPPVAALRRFFDANVPDGADDYGFADEAVDNLAMMAHGGFEPQEYVSALAERGFEIDRAHAKRFMLLVQNMIAAIPNWFNNGWSQVEMREMATGMKTFYNEEGAPMRIGGNDPCPCGSGKMYKDCHGRPRGAS